jgi:membrane protein implicated in regulation of membrane protease activity
MDTPEQWRWLWLAATAVFAIGEMATPGSFFLAPFAAGAFVAALLAFAGISVTVEWLVFVAVSVVVLALLRPLARRLDREALDHGVGSRRLVGRPATVLSDIPPGDEIGMVRVDREQWRAQSIDGTAIPAGVAVRIADVQGTRLIVAPLDPAAVAPPPASLTAPGAGIPEPPASTQQPPAGEAAGETGDDTADDSTDESAELGPDPDKPSP